MRAGSESGRPYSAYCERVLTRGVPGNRCQGSAPYQMAIVQACWESLVCLELLGGARENVIPRS